MDVIADAPELAVVPRFADYARGEDTLLLTIAARLAARTSH